MTVKDLYCIPFILLSQCGMSQPSRQLLVQREHKKLGLCHLCSDPVFSGGAHCLRHMKGGDHSKLKRREIWKQIDWTLPMQQIATMMKVSYQAARYQKQKFLLHRKGEMFKRRV